MRRLALLSLTVAVAVVGFAETRNLLIRPNRAASLRPATASRLQTPAPAEPGAIALGEDGHYWAEARVNQVGIHVLVDTGASQVALTPDDARRLGLDPDHLAYRLKVITAHGEARAATVRLASVSVAGTHLENVEALVLDHGLDASLLGMSYLGRLSGFDATPTHLTLRP